MTHFLEVEGRTLAYDVTGAGPLVVLAHGLGDTRQAYRFVAPALEAAGYRVAVLDLRGCGESSVGWVSYTRTAIAGDLLALVRHLGGPAVLVGHSIAGGAATIATAQAPDLVTSVVEIGPFTRKQQMRIGDFRVSAYRRSVTHLMGAAVLGSARQWFDYLEAAYPGRRPPDWRARSAELAASLARPGRMKVVQAMINASPTDAGEQLRNVTRRVLVVQGSADPDWASPRAEGEAIVADLPDGKGRLEMIDGAGHYPHVQYPEATVAVILPFLASTTGASADVGA